VTGGLSFTLPCVPPKTTHQSKRIVRVGKFSRLADTPELKAAHALLDTLLLPYQPAAPFTGPVSLTLTFTWPWLASDSKKVRALGRIPHAKKPDADNAAKGKWWSCWCGSFAARHPASRSPCGRHVRRRRHDPANALPGALNRGVRARHVY
jgi:Holliday junction resolvase RusA-like endonuclease